MVRKITSTLALLSVLALASATRASETEGVLAGTDWFVTLPPTSVIVNGANIPMMGDPAFPGGPDMIVTRLSDMIVPDVINSQASTPTSMTLLSLKNTSPVNFGGSFFDIYVDLAPNQGVNGTLTLTQTVAGEGTREGTFTSFFDVTFEISLTPAGQPKAPCRAGLEGNNCFLTNVFMNGDGYWTDDTANGVFIVGNAEYVADPFFVAMQIPSTPEPASLLLVCTGLAGLLALGKWGRA